MRKDFFFFVTRGMARDLCLHHSSVPSGQLYVCVYNIFPEREREELPQHCSTTCENLSMCLSRCSQVVARGLILGHHK